MKAWSPQACDIVDRLFSTPTNLWLFCGNWKILRWLMVDIPVIYSQHLPSNYIGSIQRSASCKTMFLLISISCAGRSWLTLALRLVMKESVSQENDHNKFTFLNHIIFSQVINRKRERWRKNDKKKQNPTKRVAGI